MKARTSFLVTLVLFIFASCDSEVAPGVMKSDLSKDVALTTDLGKVIFRLSDKTPKHRNNFIKLVNQGFYDSIAFHRVIEGFLIQTGNSETRDNRTTDPAEDFTIPAEINPSLFHKRGAINAARNGDDFNTDQASSGTQFTIIQGRKYTDSTLAIAEKLINNWLSYNKLINDPNYKTDFKAYTDILIEMDSLYATENENDLAQLATLEISYDEMKTKLDSLTAIVQKGMTPYSYPEAHRKIYKTNGGAAHLDQNYVVFGEVVQGMDIVDRIAAVKTDSLDKPTTDVRILSAKMIERKSYE
jgi:cyclophilin family peptidyl-prolyl cis-trans isomerase